MKLLIWIFLTLLVMTSCAYRSKEIIQQQVIAGELPDPSIIEVNGMYYATGSSNDWGPLYPIYRSSNLVDWSFVNFVFAEPPSWTMASYWAPELSYRDGIFYCYYTARRKDGISCIGVATTKNIEDGFQDKGMILEWGNEAIDAFVYDDEGISYITWKAYGLTPGKPIQILGAELTSDGLALRGEPFVMLTSEKESWEAGGMEGQCIVKHDGYLYMLYSGNSCCGASCNYQVGVARATTMKGPWQKYDQNPLLMGNSTWKCPGHGTALQNGDRWYYLYHAYNQNGFPYLGRTALLSEMFWDHKSGWPFFKPTDVNPSSAALKRDIMDTFDSTDLASQWLFNIPAYTIRSAVNDGRLTITEVQRNGYVGSAFCISPDDASFTMSTKVSGHNGALKGLVLYATSENAIGLGVKGDSLLLWKVLNNRFVVLNKLKIAEAGSIRLRAEIKQAHIGNFYYSDDGADWKFVPDRLSGDNSVVGDNLAWWSWGVKAGLMVRSDSLSGDNEASFDEFTLTYE